MNSSNPMKNQGWTRLLGRVSSTSHSFIIILRKQIQNKAKYKWYSSPPIHHKYIKFNLLEVHLISEMGHRRSYCPTAGGQKTFEYEFVFILAKRPITKRLYHIYIYSVLLWRVWRTKTNVQMYPTLWSKTCS